MMNTMPFRQFGIIHDMESKLKAKFAPANLQVQFLTEPVREEDEPFMLGGSKIQVINFHCFIIFMIKYRFLLCQTTSREWLWFRDTEQ